MIIDIRNKEILKLNSSRDIFYKSLFFINSIGKRNINNIYYELTRTTNIKDKDLNFVFHFLNLHNYVIIENDTIIVINKFNPDDIIIQFCEYYLSLIQLDRDINTALFLTSDFTIEKDSIIIKVESIPLTYRPFLLVLQKLGLMENSDKKGFVVVSNYKIAKKILERPLKKISQKDFEEELEQRKIRGDKAELFVLKSEEDKLSGLNYSPKRVSQDNVGLGYDIESYETDGTNLFIEVKSLVNGQLFYWSKNEIEVSKRLGKHYLIYAVLFDKDQEPFKIKRIIINPYKDIFISEKHKKEPSGDYLITI